MLIPVVAYLSLLFVLPIVQWLSRAFFDPGFTLRHVERLAEATVYLNILQNTVELSLLVTFVSLVLGYPLAYYLARLPVRRRGLIMILVLLPFWVSFLVRTFAWMLLLQRTGIINRGLQNAGILDEPLPLMYNTFGVTLGMVHVLMPYAVLSMLSVMQGIDRNLMAAASTMGARPWQTFYRVYFPLSVPGVAAGGLLVFIMSLGFFITPALLGGPRNTMISQAIQQQINLTLNWGFAALLAITLLAATLVIYIIYAQTVGLDSLWGTVAADTQAPAIIGKPQQRRGNVGRLTSTIGGRLRGAFFASRGAVDKVGYAITELGSRVPWTRRSQASDGSVLVSIVAWTVMAFLMLPILFVIPTSFNPGNFLAFPPDGFSLRWYELYFTDRTWTSATIRSIQVGLITAAISTVLGTMAAFAIVRGNFRYRTLLIAFLLAPMIVPRMVIAVAVFYVYARLQLVGTVTGLVLAHVVIATPFVIISVSSVLQGFDQRLEHAALTLGANRWQTFRRVIFPLIKNGVAAGALFAFIASFDELIIALFITSGLLRTLPKRMWDDIFLQVTPALAAVSTVLIAVTAVILVVATLIQTRRDGAQAS